MISSETTYPQKIKRIKHAVFIYLSIYVYMDMCNNNLYMCIYMDVWNDTNFKIYVINFRIKGTW